MDVRSPFQKGGQTSPGLDLRLPQPIAIEIEVIVVHSTVGPGLVMFGAVRRRLGLAAARRTVKLDVAVVTIRIETGVDDDDHLFQARGEIYLIGSRQLVEVLQRTGCRARFVAVDAVAEPDNDG